MPTWIPIHQEASQKLLEFRERQPELVALLNEMHEEGLPVCMTTDKDSEGNQFPLAEIDPFTFLASFNRGQGASKRTQCWAFLKDRWQLESPIPSDFDGIPVVNATNSWFISYAYKREPKDVPLLWDIFSQALNGGLAGFSDEIFNACLKIRMTAISSLTMGLFWIRPDEFVACDKKNLSQAQELGITSAPNDARSYRIWVEALRSKNVNDFAEFSNRSHEIALQSKRQITINEQRTDDAIEKFRQWISNNEAKHMLELRKVADHYDHIREWTPENLAAASEDEIATLMMSLFASGQFRNWRDGFLRDIKKNGLKAMREGITDALWGEEAPEIRFFRFHSKLHGFGAGSASELVAASNPDELSLMTGPSLTALSYLQAGLLPSTIGKIGADDYRRIFSDVFPELMRRLGKALGRTTNAIEVNELLIFINDNECADRDKAGNPSVRDEEMVLNEKSTQREAELAPPFDKIFRSIDEANALLDLAMSGFDLLGLDEDSANDPRIALTLPRNANRKGTLRLNYGGLICVSFILESNEKAVFQYGCNVSDALPYSLNSPDEEASQDSKWVSNVLVEDALKTDFEAQFRTAMAHYAERYAHWRGTPYKPHHRPELYEVFYDRSLLTEGIPDTEVTEITEPQEPEITIPPYTKEEALDELFMPEEQLDTILAQLKRKKNIILQGAPGVGKTFMAKRLAWLRMGCRDKNRVKMVQFHQSYTYEDFVQGLRPKEDGGFEIKNGIFYNLCAQASGDPDQDYFLVIDEINRGNLSKILGELMMLIECDKRGSETATLLYSRDKPFTVPDNLYLIGTMNTADRSLSLVDYALRRRFAFLTLEPGFETLSFAAALSAVGISEEQIARVRGLMAQLNEEIRKDTLNLGSGFCIGHSFFTPTSDESGEDFDTWFDNVLRYEIAPLLDEYWVDDPDKADSLKKSILGL